jgi:ferritin-like metal-binding protein YciE
MFNTAEDLIATNDRAIAALTQVLARLDNLSIGALPQEDALLQAHISRTKSQINLLNINNAHLEAAGENIKPLSDDAKSKLLDAFRRVDQAIVQNAIFSAGIDTINDVFAAVAKIGNITTSA